jgi:hypothetical protein
MKQTNDTLTAANGRGRVRLLTREHLDGRTTSARMFSQLAAQIETDLGGRDDLSAIELQLIEAFCGASILLNHLNTKLIQGEPVEPLAHAQAASTLVRVANKLGLQRRARDVSPSLRDLMRDEEAEVQ